LGGLNGRARILEGLSDSLVTCPVELFPASSLAEQTHFHIIKQGNGKSARKWSMRRSERSWTRTKRGVAEKDYFSSIPTPKFDKQMVQLAEHILDTKAAHFDPAKFKDRYETALKALVKRNAAGKKIEPAEPPAKPSNGVNLMEALKQSRSHGKKRHVSPGKRIAKASKRAKSSKHRRAA
jgi:non-homologous end joining protein Ku